MKTYRVSSYDSGARLQGTPSTELIEASADVDTGAVSAYRDGEGVWQYVREDERDHYQRNLGETVVTVYVEDV